MGTAFVVLILVAMVAAIVRYMIKARKRGEHIGCGGDCKNCHGGCHK